MRNSHPRPGREGAEVSALAETLTKMGGVLRCSMCGKQNTLARHPFVIASYMRRGWPECCGYTMIWVTARQLASRGGGDGGR